jgi:hypothetical protein
MASTYKVKLKFDKFLNGIGGILIWFFLAGTLITWVSSSGLYKSFIQEICGTSHFATIGRQTGWRLSSWIYKNP